MRNMAYNRVICLFIINRIIHSIKMNNREKGNIGEEKACDFITNLGYRIIERNHLRKWGEIDIIAVKDGELNFFEVKSSSNKTDNGYRPEENVHNLKVKRLRRVIGTYLNENKIDINSPFKFHIIVIKGDNIEMIENIIL
jgi:putative endonuclease